jgi:hypothetical protein
VHKPDHVPPSSAEFKNVWSYTATLPYTFVAWCLIKQKDNIIYLFIIFMCSYE